MGVTKYILKHPVTTVMALLCLVVFGISSVFSAKLEQMPDMETPMLIIMANYSGAGPEDISALVTEPIEEAIGTMEGVDTISSTSSDGRSMIMLQYDYGTPCPLSAFEPPGHIPYRPQISVPCYRSDS